MSKLFTASQPVIPVRAVHLDLKGVPPTFSRLMALLDVFALARYNAILVEWEDMFPWTVDERFRCETAYTAEQVREFAAAARHYGMHIIPLVQCLGHMETPLSVPGYEHLRELPHMSNCLNPLAPGARQLVERMVDDVLELLGDTKYFHLGGDEAWAFGQHPDTKAYIEKHGKGKLYLHHVEPILDKLNARSIRPILWSDMMHDWPADALTAIAQKADLCPWGYDGHPDEWTFHSKSQYIARFHEHGVPLWGATCYKNGAWGHNADVPDVPARQLNALAWVEVARRYEMKGLFVTAWSRFNTHQLQTVPIDAALDALLLVGSCLHDGQAPEGGAEACVQALDSLGQRQLFENCRAAMAKLTDVRTCAWGELWRLKEQITMLILDGRRRSSGQGVYWLKLLRNHLNKGGVQVTADTRAAFAGLMEPIWIERYLDERLEPLFEELAVMDRQVKMLEPAAYAATFETK